MRIHTTVRDTTPEKILLGIAIENKTLTTDQQETHVAVSTDFIVTGSDSDGLGLRGVSVLSTGKESERWKRSVRQQLPNFFSATLKTESGYWSGVDDAVCTAWAWPAIYRHNSAPDAERLFSESCFRRNLTDQGVEKKKKKTWRIVLLALKLDRARPMRGLSSFVRTVQYSFPSHIFRRIWWESKARRRSRSRSSVWLEERERGRLAEGISLLIDAYSWSQTIQTLSRSSSQVKTMRLSWLSG